MLPVGSAKGRQSQEMGTAGRVSASRKWWCGWSSRHLLCFSLVFGAIYIFCVININGVSLNLYPLKEVSGTSPKNSLQNLSSPDLKNSSQVSGYRNLSAFPQTRNMTSKQAASTNAPRMINLQVIKTKTPTPPPYVSPGPYLVEYPAEYHFIINEPQRCEQEKPFVVLIVPVAPDNRAHRDIIRSTWGSESLVQDKVVKSFFLLGLYKGKGEEQLNEKLLLESKEHHDLIQSNFVDCYKNLTIKTMVMLEWLNSYCSVVSYAMKIDSDMFLNVCNLIDMLLKVPRTNYMTGLVVHGARVLRDKKSKWYLPVDLYAPPQYPHYALGLGYILSLDLTKKLIKASRHVKPVYIEDVYLGLCMQHIGIPPTAPPSSNYFHVIPVPYNRCAFSRIVATTTVQKADRVWMWTDFKKPGKYCS
ncbi:beta-1,3-galactosyltransferase 1-like [Pholidichthys leucotaenia]